MSHILSNATETAIQLSLQIVMKVQLHSATTAEQCEIDRVLPLLAAIKTAPASVASYATKIGLANIYHNREEFRDIIFSKPKRHAESKGKEMSPENTSCIEHTALRGVVVITMLDEKIHTPERVQQIKDAITNVVGANPCKSVVFDMSCVKFVGSMGFLAFLAVRRLPGVENVILCNLDGEVAALFMLCRLISVDNSGNAPLKTATSVSSAIESCDAVAG